MSTIKISQLPSITGANTAGTDLIPLVDVSLNVTNKITRSEFFLNVPATTITGDLTLADKIVHSGDTNTSIRFPAADTVTVETSGSERLRIDSAGNVGIGATPFYRLHVADATLTSTTAGSNIAARLQSNGAGADVNLQFSDGVSNASQIGMVGGSVYVRTAGSERMRVDSSGNVGIGTSSVSSVFGTTVKVFSSGSGGTLDVGGSTVNARLFGSEGLSIAGFGTSTNHPFTLFTNDTERLRVDASGNLLIGTTSSGGSKLRISGLPTSSAGLSAGDVWNDGGTLKIA